MKIKPEHLRDKAAKGYRRMIRQHIRSLIQAGVGGACRHLEETHSRLVTVTKRRLKLLTN
jgi:hypothetical protein